MTIYKKLLLVQEHLNAPKNQRNNFGNYNYRSCEDIFEAVKPLLVEKGLTLLVTDSVENIGGRQYVKATAHLFDSETGEHIEVSASAREEESKKGMDSSQVTGATSSYARKYALNGLFLIDDCKDSDATNTHGKEPAKKQEPKDSLICSSCGAEFSDFKDSRGNTLTKGEWQSRSESYFGTTLCSRCMRKKSKGGDQ